MAERLSLNAMITELMIRVILLKVLPHKIVRMAVIFALGIFLVVLALYQVIGDRPDEFIEIASLLIVSACLTLGGLISLVLLSRK
jgi:hypothetical protein